jgi:MFS transporter, DHA3 family, macrolide efflux protein
MTKPAAIFKLRAFIITWFGQLISLIGSGLTGFAFGVWVYQKTGSTTLLALISLFTTLPGIVLSPIVGVLVDRWERRWTMIISNSVAAGVTLLMALLFFANSLDVWHIYVGMSVISVCSALQYIAYTAATTLLVPKQHLGRASGMVQIGEASARIFSPALAGILVWAFKLQGVLLIDFTSYIIAIITLWIVQFPKPEATTEEDSEKKSLLREAFYGWNYVIVRPGLMGLLGFFAIGNFVLAMASVLITPMILAFASATILGNVLSLGGSGMLIGSVLMSVWGGPRYRMLGMFYFGILQGICVILIGLRPSIPLITVGTFGVFFTVPIIAGCSQAIWQTKVPPEVQGRVFAVRRMITWSTFPLAYLLAGPLADYVFEPLLAGNSPLAGNIGKILSVGAGRGIGLLFMVLGTLTVVAILCSYLYKPLRMIEKELPDAIPND